MFFSFRKNGRIKANKSFFLYATRASDTSGAQVHVGNNSLIHVKCHQQATILTHLRAHKQALHHYHSSSLTRCMVVIGMPPHQYFLRAGRYQQKFLRWIASSIFILTNLSLKVYSPATETKYCFPGYFVLVPEWANPAASIINLPSVFFLTDH